MDTLIPFLKSSSVLDLLVILLVILSTVILVPVGIWIAFASRTRKPVFFFLMFALLPLLLAFLGTCLRFMEIERAVSMFPDASREVVMASRQEAWITTYIGAAGTVILGLIGASGLVLPKAGTT